MPANNIMDTCNHCGLSCDKPPKKILSFPNKKVLGVPTEVAFSQELPTDQRLP